MDPRRRSTRLTITVPASVADALQQRAKREGRSLSNLASWLIEQHALQQGQLEDHR
jgi:hypothetical protein